MENVKTEVMENAAEVVTENREVIEKILTSGSSKKQIFIILASMFGTAVAIYVCSKAWSFIRKPKDPAKPDDQDNTEAEEPTTDTDDETEEK